MTNPDVIVLVDECQQILDRIAAGAIASGKSSWLAHMQILTNQPGHVAIDVADAKASLDWPPDAGRSQWWGQP